VPTLERSLSALEDLTEDNVTDTALDLEDPNPSIDRQSVRDKKIDAGSMEPGQQQTLSGPEPPKQFSALKDPRLDEHSREHAIYTDKVVDRKVLPVEDWRLSLMCIEWIHIPSGGVEQGKGKEKEATRRVASRLDVMRFGPSVSEWLDLGPTRIDIVLV
jgi:hypothetical protein